jgi:hypothetical protein
MAWFTVRSFHSAAFEIRPSISAKPLLLKLPPLLKLWRDERLGARRRERIVIPIHGNQPLKKGLLRSLMKIAGLHEEDL